MFLEKQGDEVFFFCLTQDDELSALFFSQSSMRLVKTVLGNVSILVNTIILQQSNIIMTGKGHDKTHGSLTRISLDTR